MFVSSFGSGIIGPHLPMGQNARHDTWELAWLSGGRVAVRVEGISFVHNADSLLLLAPGDLHSSWTLDEGVRTFVLHLHRHALPTEMVTCRVPITEPLRALLSAIPRQAKSRQELEHWAQRLVARIASSPTVAGEKGSTDERILRAVTTVLSAPSDSYSVGSLAKIAGLSPYHFSRLFRETMDISPMLFVRTHRVQLGRRMLQTTDLTVTRVASLCGFRATSRFSEAFREMHGCTPSAYRQGIAETMAPTK